MSTRNAELPRGMHDWLVREVIARHRDGMGEKDIARALSVAASTVEEILDMPREPRPESGSSRMTRPKTRGECVGASRPCPWVGCRYHLFLDVRRTGTILFNFPEAEDPIEAFGRLEGKRFLPVLPSCALDVAESVGSHDSVVAGRALGVTRERVRQITDVALAKAAPELLLRGVGP